MEKYHLSYLSKLGKYQAVVDALKENVAPDGWTSDSQANISEKTGLTQPKVSKILDKMSKPGGVLEKRTIWRNLSRYRILYPDLGKEGPMAEIPLVFVLLAFLELENKDVKNKAKRCGVSQWTYQRARAYINEDMFYIKNNDAEYTAEFQKLFNETMEKYKDRIDEALNANADILREEVIELAVGLFGDY